MGFYSLNLSSLGDYHLQTIRLSRTDSGHPSAYYAFNGFYATAPELHNERSVKKERQLQFQEFSISGRADQGGQSSKAKVREGDNVFKRSPTAHGGELSKGKRKTRRPISLKKSMHLVMRSSRAKGNYSLRAFHNKPTVEKLIKRYALMFDIRIYQFTIHFNHIHIALRAKNRENLQNFLRALTGNIAVKILKAKKGLKRGKFWDLLAFTRIVEWGRAFKALIKYVIQNELEARGEIPYRPRGMTKCRSP
jgi:REP element-mobilizing transposase RayT